MAHQGSIFNTCEKSVTKIRLSPSERVGPIIGLNTPQFSLPKCSRKHVVLFGVKVQVGHGGRCLGNWGGVATVQGLSEDLGLIERVHWGPVIIC
jgi:hypothetical protein